MNVTHLIKYIVKGNWYISLEGTDESVSYKMFCGLISESTTHDFVHTSEKATCKACLEELGLSLLRAQGK